MSNTNTEKATFAAGCFWGVQHLYDKLADSGIVSTRVGYIGGNTEDPDYKKVCSGTTNHAEAVEVIFEPEKVSYEKLVEFFYSMHDPTTENAQGPDKGTQYRSAIFYHSQDQKVTAEDVTVKVQEDHFKGKKIVTQIIPAGVFYNAEEYHQKYLTINPSGYACPSHVLRWEVFPTKNT